MTKGDWVRHLTDEELAQFLRSIEDDGLQYNHGKYCNPGKPCGCPYAKECAEDNTGNCKADAILGEDCDIIWWLKQPM